MRLATVSSIITPAKYCNNIVEEEVINQTEYDTVDSAWGYTNPNGNIYVFNLKSKGGNNSKRNSDKDKQHTISLKKAKEKIVEGLTKINLYKAQLQNLNPSDENDAIIIRKLNLKIHKEMEKIRKLEREFNLDASQYQSQSTTPPPKSQTFSEKIKEGWIKFWTAIKDFFSKHLEEIASVATISCSILLLIIKCIK